MTVPKDNLKNSLRNGDRDSGLQDNKGIKKVVKDIKKLFKRSGKN
jgi:hypothetical protein